MPLIKISKEKGEEIGDKIAIGSSVLLNIGTLIRYDKDELIIELKPKSFSLDYNLLKSSGRQKEDIFPIKKEEKEELKSKQKIINDLKKCRWYIGSEDEFLLLSYFILGPDNCIVLTNEESDFLRTFPFFEAKINEDICLGMVEDELMDIFLYFQNSELITMGS